MLGSIHFMKYGAGNMAAAIMLLLGTSAESHAQTGTVHFTVVNAGFIVSTGSGTGTLSYHGKEYRGEHMREVWTLNDRRLEDYGLQVITPGHGRRRRWYDR